MIIKETFGGAALLASFSGVDATWLSNAMIFIAAAAATIFYIKGAVKKSPPDTEKYRHVAECDKLCKANLDAHEKLDREMNERLTSMSGHSAASRKVIYESVRKLSEDVAALKSSNEYRTQQLNAVESKINKIWEILSK